MKYCIILTFALLLSGCPEPQPLPSPSPSPAQVTPSPSPSPPKDSVPGRVMFTASANWEGAFAKNVVISAAPGETRGVWMRINASDGCPTVIRSGLIALFYGADPQTAATPSYLGAPKMFYDRLLPINAPCADGLYFVDISGAGTLQVGDASLELKALSWTMPARPSMPLYVGLNPSYTGRLGMDGSVSIQGPLVASTVKLLRDSRIEPFSQFVLSYPKVKGFVLDIDEWKAEGASFRQLVLDGAIAPPCLVPPLRDTPRPEYLASVQTMLQAGALPAGSWAYGWDEDQLASPTAALARINAIKAAAPALDVWATREPDAKFSAVDTFAPVLDWFRGPGHVQDYPRPFGLYTSCMGQGCSGGPRKPSGAPLMVADAPAVDPLAFPLVAAALGASRALYYSAVDGFGVNLAYKDNGNGDGQLLYAGPKTVYPSVRLKLLREGMFMVEYMKRKPEAFARLVQGGTSFSHDYAAWESARASASN